ncbi:MAG: protein kinase domain-containing protein [Acidobacteriota bacterium]
MSLKAGESVGPYRILAPLGRGGMGEVYRARDTRLERDVALKVIREEKAADAEGLERFRRETRAVAALNHPGILAIYDTGVHGGAPYAVMELLAGETLAERLEAGPLPQRDASETAARIADALAAAHAHGVVHRDVKPSNVFLTEDGQTKILDFGIARRAEAGPAGSGTAESTLGQTSGALMGTAGYVSPEQVRGRPADARSDVFSLGATVYEALTGRKAFSGLTAAETLSAVLGADPGGYPETGLIPPELRRIVLRCLEKDPANRYQSARDVALDLRAWQTGALAQIVPQPPPPRRRGRTRLLLAAAGALLLGLGLYMGRRMRPAPPNLSASVTRVTLALSPPLSLSTAERPFFSISPDGKRLVYVAEVEGRTRLEVRDTNSLETRSLPGTEDATGPFFSPDGNWVGFFAGQNLKKVSLAGGASASVGPGVPPVTRGASWGPDDRIVFCPANTHGLVARRASTGEQERLAWPDYDRGEQAYWWPELLPGGKAALFVIRAGDTFETASIAALRLDNGAKKILLQGGTSPRYAPTGHLVYARGGTLLAAPFDPERLEVTGASVPLISGIRTEATGAAQYAFSGNGTLLYLPGPSPSRASYRLVRVDRGGKVQPFAFAPGDYYGPRFSPDGKRLAVVRGDANQDVWIADLERGLMTRLTPEASEEFDPVWSPDGRRIAYTSERRSLEPQIFLRAADGSGEEEPLWKKPVAVFAQAWSPDGKVLALAEAIPGTRWDLWTLEIGREARPFLVTPYFEAEPDFSPDGRWIAYTSNESGNFEIYARPFPGPGGRVQISTDGGVEPAWSRDGRELFYRKGDRMMAVPVRSGAHLSVGRPAVLFETSGLLALPTIEIRQYDPAPDGQSFVMIRLPDAQAPAPSPILVVNWFAELERKVAERP